MNLTVRYEDNHLIVMEKPAAMLTQGDSSGARSLMDYIKEYLKVKYNKPGNVFLGMVHRLDKPVSGLIIFARTSKAANRLSEQFAGRDISKYYIALVKNDETEIPKEWHRLQHHLVRERDKTVLTDKGAPNAQFADLQYHPVIVRSGYALLVVKLLTGRKHQIRAQLRAAGMPIIGDVKYGSVLETDGKSICLHSYFLGFTHPTKKEKMVVRSEIPESFKIFLQHDNSDMKGIAEKIDEIINEDHA